MMNSASPDLLRHLLIKRLSLATIRHTPLSETHGHSRRDTGYDSLEDWSAATQPDDYDDHSNGNVTSRQIAASFTTPRSNSSNDNNSSVNSTFHPNSLSSTPSPAFPERRRYFSSAEPLRNQEDNSRVTSWLQLPSPLNTSLPLSAPQVRGEPGQNPNSLIKRRRSSSGLRSMLNYSPTAPKPFIRRGDIVFGGVIGKGAFGQVYKGILHGRPVAIKVVQKRRGSGIHREILQAERLAFSMNLRHEHIVNILGVNFCDGVRGDALIVMELVSPRTLQSVLDDSTRDISTLDRIRFSVEITKALDYLHMNDVVHLDVKPRNVLMTSDDRCKLADFGSLTQTCFGAPKENVEYTQLLGTLAYRAPELMNRCFPSSKADIYSLGITLWQMATRETPYFGANPHWLIYQVVKANQRPGVHYSGNNPVELRYKELYVACWDAAPQDRPRATDVLGYLADIRDSLEPKQ